MQKLKLMFLNWLFESKITKTKLVMHKRSHHHPMLHKQYFHDSFGVCEIVKVWNIKYTCSCLSWSVYEQNTNIQWEWKIKVKTDTGYYVMKLHEFVPKAVERYSGKKIDDSNIFVFYK